MTTRNNILLTGAGGYFGKFLPQYIREYFPSAKIYYLDKNLPSNSKCGRDWITCDLCNANNVRKILLRIKPRLIFHLAGSGISINLSQEEFFERNFLTTRNLLESVNSIKGFHPRIVLIGSAAEYGDISRIIQNGKVINENTLPNPVSAYGYVKALQTILARYYANVFGLDIVVVRPFNIIGPDMSEHTAIGNFQRQVKEIILRRPKTAVIYAGNTKVSRDYVDVRDAMRGICLVAIKGRKGEIYNISSGKSRHLIDILRMMCSYCKDTKIKILQRKDLIRKNDVRDTRGSNLKIKLHTGWRPTIDIRKSVDDWYRMVLSGSSIY